MQIVHFFIIIKVNINLYQITWEEDKLFNNTYKIIAVCLADIDSNYNDKFLKSLSKYSAKYNYKLLYFCSFSSLYSLSSGNKHELGESAIFNLINYNIIDGVIILSETIKCDDILNTIIKNAKAHMLPVITIDRPLEGCYNVSFDCKAALGKIINHIIEDHGYKRINFIAGIRGNQHSEERISIYRSALEKHNIPFEKERIGYGDFWAVPTKKVIEDFINSELPFPEAIVCANDSMAIAAIYYLAQNGFNVPGDVAVTGFDALPEALDHTPSITTVEHDYDKIILNVFDMFEKYFNNKKIPESILVKSKFIPGASCGCKAQNPRPALLFTHKVYQKLDDYKTFNNLQITMSADLTDNTSFQGVFENLMKYSGNFFSKRFWMCIVDNFLINEEELSDILEEKTFHRNGYSGHMDIMLACHNGEWQGMTDFETSALLPSLELLLTEENNIMFLPLHVLDHTIGYVAIVYDADLIHMEHLYQFLMNVSNALETMKIHQRQQNIISNLENKYIHDPLTGLLNRRGFYQMIMPLYKKCIETLSEVFVVSVDLNELKFINDTYGHADGDIAILTVGKALNFSLKDNEACARFGGDEYVLAGPMPDNQREDEFRHSFQQYIDNFNKTSGKPYIISASIGIATGIPNENISLDDFIKFADEEMYKDKVQHHMCRN